MITRNLSDVPVQAGGYRTPDVGVIIPTRNAAKHWHELRLGLDAQDLSPSQVLIIDSSSTDETRVLAQQAGYRVVCIPQEEFNHGATRQLACSYLPERAFLLFMTQDVLLAAADSVERLRDALAAEDIGAAYGRQLPRPGADPIEQHGRLFNYPEVSQTRDLECRGSLGFKTVFLSNSFALYRRSALEAVGGFPVDGIVSEEVSVSAKMLLAGWKIAYVADARVFHSHPLTLVSEFSRYFDIGVHHGREPWLLENFGGAGGEGLRFVKSQLGFLYKKKPSLIPYALLRMASKYVAYRLGAQERHLPVWLSRRISGQPGFWNQEAALAAAGDRIGTARQAQLNAVQSERLGRPLYGNRK